MLPRSCRLGGSRGLSWRPAPCSGVQRGAAAAGSGAQGLSSRIPAPAEAAPRTATSAAACCSSFSLSSPSPSCSDARQPFWGRRQPHHPASGKASPRPGSSIGSSSPGSSQPTSGPGSSHSSSSSSHAPHTGGPTGNTLNSGSGEFPTDPFKSAYDNRVPPGLAAGRNMVNTRTGPSDLAAADSSSDEDDPHHIARSAAVSSAAAGAAGAASEAAAAQLAAAAVAVAAAQMAAPPPRVGAVRLLGGVAGLLRSHFLPVLLLYAVKDAAAFCLHRVVQRLTNHGGPGREAGREGGTSPT